MYIAKYLRVSEDDEDTGRGKRESDSIVNQRKMLDSYITSHGELSKYPSKEFIDDGVSGVNFRRPAVGRLLKEVQEGKIFCIVVKDLSRFGRNYIEVGDYIEQIFPFLGVRFISVSDHFDSFQNMAGIDLGFKNLIHDMYSRDLSGKVKSAISVRQKRGCYHGGGIPFGYKLGEGASFVPDEEAAKIVRKIFTLAADANTTSRIADLLNQEAVPTPGAYKKQHGGISYCFQNGKQNLWTASQVNLIIRNEVYRGTYVAHKLSTIKPGVVKKNEKAAYVTLDNHHERLVEEDLFRKAQAVLKQRGKMKKRAEYASALKGKVKCGCCGYSMSVRREAKEPYYRCQTGKGCGAYTKINVELLEITVWQILQKYMGICLDMETCPDMETCFDMENCCDTQAGLWQEKKQQKEHQMKRMQMLTAATKKKEEKRLPEMQIEHCRISRLELYHKWKEGRMTKEEYIRRKEELNQFLEESGSMAKASEQEKGPDVRTEAQSLFWELVDELIERIEVYGDDRAEIKWKINDVFV